MSNQELIEQQNQQITRLVNQLKIEEKVNAMYSTTYNEIIDMYKNRIAQLEKTIESIKQIK